MTDTTLDTTLDVTRPCTRCGGEVTSKNPDFAYCLVCFYTGQGYHQDAYQGLIDEISEVPGVKSASISHTGGGCFGIGIYLDDGRYAFVTDAYEEENGERWGDATLDNGPQGLHWLTFWSTEDDFYDGEEPQGEAYAIGTAIPALLAEQAASR